MSDILGYAGKRVIVTGCFSGMGQATAQLLLDLGAEVHGVDYKAASLPLASFTNVDLRDTASIDAGLAKIGGNIDALFNCAGLPQSFPPLDVMKVNFFGLRHLTMAVVEKMGKGGAIASIASTGGLGWSRRLDVNMEIIQSDGFDAGVAWAEAHMDMVAEGYSLSKENVIVWTQYMGAQLIKKGIRINCSLPSPTETPMLGDFEATVGGAVLKAAAEPLGRYSTPAEQAAGIVLLNSALAGIINGVVLPVDGGFMGAMATGQLDMSAFRQRSGGH